MTTTWSETDLLRELNQVVETELNRHLQVAKEWFPHEYIPWSDGPRTSTGSWAATPGRPSDSPTDRGRPDALLVNLLTEDNLPSYHREIATHLRPRRRVGRLGRTAGPPRRAATRSSCATTSTVTRDVDPVELERVRMAHMSAGLRPRDHGDSLMRSLAYVSFQELATRVAPPQHRQATPTTRSRTS